jgi:methylmalonyl-CoA mutase N-terminal domain/subunit
VSLTAQQPENNIVRTAIEALSAVLGGTNSLHTNALDEVLALPSAKAAEIAVRTQQVILEETGATNVADPLGGSWYVEALTDRIEAQAEEIFQRIKDIGGDGSITAGLLRGIDEGYFTGEIAEASFRYQQAVEKGEKRIVGVNAYTESIEEPLEILRVSHEVELAQNRELAARRAGRDNARVQATLAELRRGAEAEGVNLIPPMLEAVRAEATLGEICDVLKDVFGTYTEPARF